MGSVTHTTVVVVPDDPAYPVGTDEWNAGHSVTLTATDVGADAAGAAAAAQAASWPATSPFDATAPAAVGTAAAGAAATVSHRDHVHPTGAGTPSTQAFGDSASTGTGPAASMTDHKHAMPANPVAYAAPSLTLGTANAAGSAASAVRTDATILAFDATTPAAVGTAAVGAATVAARRDHVHATGAGTPSTQAFGDAASTGSGPAASMTDHKHAMPAFGTTASGLGTSAGGSATTASKSDHVHASPAMTYRTGATWYYTVPGGVGSSVTLVQSTLYTFPIYIPFTTTFDLIAVMTAAGVASSSARLGIYNDTAGVPDTLLLDAGSVATTSGGTKSISISQSLTGGTWYWLACAVQGAAGSLWTMTAGNYRGVVPTTAPFTGDNGGYAQTSVTSTLPAPWGATKTETSRVPFIWIAPH